MYSLVGDVLILLVGLAYLYSRRALGWLPKLILLAPCLVAQSGEVDSAGGDLNPGLPLPLQAVSVLRSTIYT